MTGPVLNRGVDMKQLEGIWHDPSAFESGRSWPGPSKGVMTVVGRFLATGRGLEESEDLTCSFWIRQQDLTTFHHSTSV
jgi:hypothetical protein